MHIGPDNQLLQHAKEDKEKWLKKMEKADDKLNNNNAKVSNTLDGIG